MIDLIIPTYNRPYFLRRILDYYNSYKVNYNIIVADSSSKDNKKLNKDIISSYPKLKILYIDQFPMKMVSHQKFGQMVKYAKSKYVCFCADDDFITPSGIKEAINFLEKNPDYSSAHGTYISFYIFKSLFNSKSFWWKFIYPYKSITSLSPKERLISHLSNYYQVLWAVRRTGVVKKSYEEFIKFKVDPILFGELLPDMLTLMCGKMKRLNTFYGARQAFSTSYSYWPSVQDSIKMGTYKAAYRDFRNCIASNLQKFGILKQEAEKIVDLHMSKYLKHSTQEHLTGRVNLFLKQFPDFISKSLRLLYVIYLFSEDKKDRIGQINSLSSKYFQDFNNIRKFVLKYEKTQ